MLGSITYLFFPKREGRREKKVNPPGDKEEEACVLGMRQKSENRKKKKGKSSPGESE
jgi:hypothetical protein